MRCIHKDCICPDCGHFESGDCWRKKKCEETQKSRGCPGYVAECSRYEPAQLVKREGRP